MRHGKDEDGFRGGWSQRGLIEKGIQQSKKLGSYLRSNKDFNISRIISSDLRRALETSRYIAESLQLPIEESKCWRETNNGVLAGMSNAEANEKYPGLYFNSLRMDERYPGGGESPIENFARIKKALESEFANQIEGNHQENVIIVTHGGGVINIIYHILKGKEWSNKNKPFPTLSTSVHKVEFIKDNWKLTQENLVNHLL
ncbi:histidine phosphatase family protein [Gracilibacillus sp. JCM 18860]|uniref:histidine phosphatase family protein n=1 Tax=Gracilibacillus sp. JCM 18860 TaxID=1306159 RepID=UPI000B0CB1C0